MKADELLLNLTEPGVPPAIRAESAERALLLGREAKVADRLRHILLHEGEMQEGRQAVLAALGRSWNPPPRLLSTLIRMTEVPTSSPPPPALLMPAIAAYRSPDALLVLIRQISMKHPPAVRSAAVQALVSVTGREDLGSDRGAWLRWLAANRELDSVRWRDELARGVWQRQHRLAQERATLSGRLIDGHRRLYLAMPADGADRPRMLIQLLGDGTPELRDLGLDLLSREISAGKAIDPGAVEAAALLLRSPDPGVRSRAAVMVTQLAPPHVDDRIAQALADEQNPEAAGSLLLAAARWPTSAVVEPAIRWLEHDPVFPGAMEALLAPHAEGLLRNADDIHRASAALRRIDVALLSPAACHLLAEIGEAEDRQRIATLLDGASGPMKAAAARALSEHPDFVDAILGAASKDPTLFEIAVECVARGRPTPEGFDSLRALEAPTESERFEGLVRVSLSMPLPALLAVVRDPSHSAEFRDAILSRLTDPTVVALPGPAMGDANAAVEALLMLAETRLELGRPNHALAALLSLPEPLTDDNILSRARSLRVIGLLWTNQIELAMQEDASASDWLDGLERAIDEPHADAIAAEIGLRFTGVMTDEELERLQRLRAQLAPVDERAQLPGQIPAPPEH